MVEAEFRNSSHPSWFFDHHLSFDHKGFFMPIQKKTLQQKIDGKYRVTPGCWIWIGAKKKDGYGYVQHEGREFLAHRAAYFLRYGDLNPDLCICHRCDNRLCVNPDHLWQGTALENDADKVAKGRQARGERMGSAKLNEQKVLEIRAAFTGGRDGENTVSLGRKYGMHPSTIWAVVNRVNWKS